MSTIKSSAEDLTLNADGSGNDIKFQSNGSEVGSLTAEGVLTATSFAGSGAALTGLSSFDPDGAVTINDTGADVDFRVESDNDTTAFFVQGSDGFIGIGTGIPSTLLHIKQDTDSVVTTTIENKGSGTTARHLIKGISSGTGSGTKLIELQSDGNTTPVTQFVVNAEGNVGIGGAPESGISGDCVEIDMGLGSISAWKSEGANTSVGLGHNCYKTGGLGSFKAKKSSSGGDWRPSVYEQCYGQHYFKVATSGTADSAITWSTAMTINNDGSVTKPAQPCFSVTCPGQTNISQGAYDGLKLTNEIYDIGSNFNTGTYEFTAPVTGKYFISVHFKMEQIQNGASYIRFLLTTSNRGYSAQLDPRVFDTDGDYWSVYITHLCDLDANDTARARLKQIGGSSHMDLSTESMMTGILLA